VATAHLGRRGQRQTLGGAAMSPESIRFFVFTDHARFEMARRGLIDEMVRAVLERPEQRWELRPGRHVLQSRIPMGEPPKKYIVRVLVDVDEEPPAVVTAYRTSKMSKYWRQEP
jgi:hypothetical protein